MIIPLIIGLIFLFVTVLVFTLYFKNNKKINKKEPVKKETEVAYENKILPEVTSISNPEQYINEFKKTHKEEIVIEREFENEPNKVKKSKKVDEKSLLDEIQNLSPELKAMLFSDTINKRDF